MIESNSLPFVSICTITFNRRPFINMMKKCFEHQDYPKDKIEWIIVDDGTDKIEDLVKEIPQVKYFPIEKKLSLGKKRNMSHDKSSGEIIIYMDDDDYYPSDRISHAVSMLMKNPDKLIAGSSEMYIYFKHIKEMYKLGPYGKNHATAATFAFKRELLKITKYEEEACMAEEKFFLKDYSIPMIQLDPFKSILVFSHEHNSFDKRILLEQIKPNVVNNYISKSSISVDDYVKDKDIYNFFINDIDELLRNYTFGDPVNKPDVQLAQCNIQLKREKLSKQRLENELVKMSIDLKTKQNIISQLELNINLLKDKNQYLTDKLSVIIKDKIDMKKKKEMQLS